MNEFDEKMHVITHSKDLLCAKGYEVRQREWGLHGARGCFDGKECPDPLCTIPNRHENKGKNELV